MQLTLVEFGRHVLGFSDAHSQEFNPDTTHPMVHIMADQDGVTDLGGTLRLGSYPCVLTEGSKAYELYGEKEIHERHRHRYEVNNEYRDIRSGEWNDVIRMLTRRKNRRDGRDSRTSMVCGNTGTS